MGSVNQISPDEAENSGMEERKQHIQCEHKDVRNVIFKDGQGLSEEDESQNHAVLEDMDNNDAPSFAQQAGLQKQQRQPSGPIVHWDRFLPVGALKVLLVENDDSTRQVVGALLRNCSYEVIAAANGLQAWKILEDMINNIDLVLTEIFMPSLCGITLLSKIMSRKTCMNIPVIMMSSNDSIGTIFKCLSKGAVDFLVKPIRKNELKNLWQHFWRRCHSSSGSGIQTQKSIKTKSAHDSDNNSGSNDDENGNGSSGLNARDGSDNGSVTQSSCTKRALEVECPQRVPLSDQITDPPDSTCAQVIHPNPETFCNDWVPHPASGECQGQKESTDELMGKDLEIGIPRNAVLNYETTPDVKVCSKLTYESVDKLPGNDQKNEGSPGRECDNVLTSEERSAQAAHLIGEIAKYPDTQTVTPASQAPNGSSKTTECQDKHTEGTTDLPSLELSLKRLRSVGELGSSTHEERNVLRRSEQSAFSRYRKSATSNQAPNGYGGSCSPLDNGSEATRAESSYNMISSSQAAPLKKGSNGSSNNTGMSFTNNMMSSPDAVPLKQGSAGSSGNSDMGSSTKNVFTKSAPNKEKPASTSAGTFTQTPTFRPVQIRTSTDQQILQQKTNEPLLAGATGQAREIQRQVVEYHHHHYDHHHLHLHNMQQQQQHPPDHDDLPPNNMAVAAPQCWSSNVSVGPVEGNDANFSINGSNSGSMQGSNGHNRGSTTAIPLALNIQGASGIAENRLGGGNASGRSNGSVAVDHIRFAQREAALRKFRQKRKERNFGKKVRYQSRKRLAEQRPRVRGQFVKQTVREQNGQEEER